MRTSLAASLRRAAVTALLLVWAAAAHAAATITIVNMDGPNEGFNDPTPAAPVGGNPGTTIGQQRLFVFQYAASIWGSILYSNVEILVEAQFDPLTCDGSSAVLGSAGPNQIWANFDNAPYENTWYHEALANKLAGYDLDPATADISANFNSDLGQEGCFPLPWYYGVDGNEGTTAVELLPVVLHELGHGLGFSTSSLGGVQQVFPHIYDRFLYDNTQQMHWYEMTDPQRTASTQNCNNLVWDGPSSTLQAPSHLGPKPLLRVNNGPNPGDRGVGLPAFGPGLSPAGVTGDLVLVNDGMGMPNNGCEPFLNSVAGKIALIDRGGCNFTVKVKNAQDAGAIGVVVADSVPGCPALGMGGADPTITIPSVRITNDDGAQLKSALLVGPVNVTLIEDPALMAGADAAGRVQVYTVIPFAPGSSVSHWNTAATPNLLMEPALNFDESSDVDLTIAHFADIGWFQGLLDAGSGRIVSTTRLSPSYPNPASRASTIAFTLSRADRVRLEVFDATGRRVRALIDARLPEGSHTARWDGRLSSGAAAPAGVYLYRLTTSEGAMSQRLAIVR